MSGSNTASSQTSGRVPTPPRRCRDEAVASNLGQVCQGKFDAAAHGVDAFGADADAIAVLPHELALLFAAAAALGTAPFAGTTVVAAVGHGDDGVILFAIDAPGPR